jgi:hypothetical protein
MACPQSHVGTGKLAQFLYGKRKALQRAKKKRFIFSALISRLIVSDVCKSSSFQFRSLLQINREIGGRRWQRLILRN